MTDRPMLFNCDMVRAILSGRKTQTRRPMKVQPSNDNRIPAGKNTVINILDERAVNYCPFGKPGDRIWVRETMASDGDDWWFPAADCGEFNFPLDGYGNNYRNDVLLWMKKQRDARRISVPSIHMPRWACRIVLEIIDVRVQRVQEINALDAIDEGGVIPCMDADISDGVWPAAKRNAVSEFAALWNDCYGSGAWERNDWVWALTFKRVEGESK